MLCSGAQIDDQNTVSQKKAADSRLRVEFHQGAMHGFHQLAPTLSFWLSSTAKLNP